MKDNTDEALLKLFKSITRETLRNVAKKYSVERGKDKLDTIKNLMKSNIDILQELKLGGSNGIHS